MKPLRCILFGHALVKAETGTFCRRCNYWSPKPTHEQGIGIPIRGPFDTDNMQEVRGTFLPPEVVKMIRISGTNRITYQ